MTRHISVGVPVYRGSSQIAEALAALQRQTHKDFDVLISVDGNDQETADACLPFLADSRFRLTVQDQRLDWNGNLNWLLNQPIGDYFCYRQHDDTTTPEFFEKLLALAEKRPDAAIVYADCQWIGGRNHIEAAPELDGGVFPRMRRFIEEKQPAPVRGLMRKAAVAQAGMVRIDEFRGLSEVFVWLAKLLRWGPFLRLGEALYIRRDHPENYHKQWHGWPEAKKREAWTTMFTGLLEAVNPICASPEIKAAFELLILERVAIRRTGRSYHYDAPPNIGEGVLIGDCYRRLAKEGLQGLSVLAPVLARETGLAAKPEEDEGPDAVSRFAQSEYRAQVPSDFDAEAYLFLNPDVRSAGIDPFLHYVRHGKQELRRYTY